VKVEGVLSPSQSVSETLGLDYPAKLRDEDAAEQSSTRAQHAESECDDLGTIVTEVTTTTVTTRKRYRVADA